METEKNRDIILTDCFSAIAMTAKAKSNTTFSVVFTARNWKLYLFNLNHKVLKKVQNCWRWTENREVSILMLDHATYIPRT